MPAALIEVCRQYAVDEEIAVIDAVHSALVEAFRIPPEDRNIRLIVHEPHRFACSADLTYPEYRTIVTIDCFAGRSLDAKRKLYAAIVEQLGTLGIPGDHVSTILHEIDRDNWGLGGGHAASDVDLGFLIDV